MFSGLISAPDFTSAAESLTGDPFYLVAQPQMEASSVVTLHDRVRDNIGGLQGRWFSRPSREVHLPPENGRSTLR